MDSRITVAKRNVRAVVDIFAEVDASIAELMGEDPAFPLKVQQALQRASSALGAAASQVMIAHAALRTADHIENPRSA